jgi:hypothetical protein
MKTVRALKKQYGDRHLAVGRRRQLKKRTQGDGGSRKKLAAACRGMTCRAIPALRKGRHQGPGRDNVARGAPKGQTLYRRRRTHQEGSNGIRDEGLKKQLRLGSEKTSCRIFGMAFVLEIVKQRVEPSVRIRKMSD